MRAVVELPIRRKGVLPSLVFGALIDDGGADTYGLTAVQAARDVRGMMAGQICATTYVARIAPAVREFTYFARMETPFGRRKHWSPVKIGTSNNPRARMESFQTSSPFPITLVASISDVLLPELALHSEFGKYRLRGEWFALHRRLRRLVDQVVLFGLVQERMHPEKCSCRSVPLQSSCNASDPDHSQLGANVL